MAEFYATSSEDSSLMNSGSYQRALGCLTALRTTLESILARGGDGYCYLIYNGTRHIMELADAMGEFKVPIATVEILVYALIALESQVPLLSVKYLPWRTKLYLAISRKYLRAGMREAAKNVIASPEHGGLAKIDQLENLEKLEGKLPKKSSYVIDMCRSALEAENLKTDILSLSCLDQKAVEKILGRRKDLSDQQEIYILMESAQEPDRRTMLNAFHGFGKHAGLNPSKENLAKQSRQALTLSLATKCALPYLRDLHLYVSQRVEKPAGDDIKADSGSTCSRTEEEANREVEDSKLKVSYERALECERTCPLRTHIKMLRAAFALKSWEDFHKLIEIAIARINHHAKPETQSLEKSGDADFAVWQVECKLLRALSSLQGCAVKDSDAKLLVNILNEAIQTKGVLERRKELFEDAAAFLWALPVKVWLRKLKSMELKHGDGTASSKEWRTKANLLIPCMLTVYRVLSQLDYPDIITRSQIALEIAEILQLQGELKAAAVIVEEVLKMINIYRSRTIIEMTTTTGFGTAHSIRAHTSMKISISAFHPLLPREKASVRSRMMDTDSSRVYKLSVSIHGVLLSKFFHIKLLIGLRSATKRARQSYKKQAEYEKYMADFKSTFKPYRAKLLEPETSKKTEAMLMKLCGSNHTWKALLLIQMAHFRKNKDDQHSLLLRAHEELRYADNEEISMARRVGIEFSLYPSDPQHGTDVLNDDKKSLVLPPPMLVARTSDSIVLRPVIPPWYIAKHKLRGFVVFGKESTTGIDVSQVDADLMGTGVERQLPSDNENLPDVIIFGLRINTKYCFAVLGVNRIGEYVAYRGGIGATCDSISTILPLPAHFTWGNLSVAAMRSHFKRTTLENITDRAIEEFICKSPPEYTVPLLWRSNMPFFTLNLDAMVSASLPSIHLLVKLLLLRADLYDLHTPTLKTGKYTSPLAYVESHILKQCQFINLALQACLVANDAEITDYVIQRSYNAMVPLLRSSQTSGVGPLILQCILPAYLASCSVRDKLTPSRWSAELNRVSARCLFEIVNLYRGHESSPTGNPLEDIVSRQIALIRKAANDYQELKARCVTDQNEMCRGENQSEQSPVQDFEAYRLVFEDRALSTYLLGDNKLTKHGSQLCKLTWEMWKDTSLKILVRHGLLKQSTPSEQNSSAATPTVSKKKENTPKRSLRRMMSRSPTKSPREKWSADDDDWEHRVVEAVNAGQDGKNFNNLQDMLLKCKGLRVFPMLVAKACRSILLKDTTSHVANAMGEILDLVPRYDGQNIDFPALREICLNLGIPSGFAGTKEEHKVQAQDTKSGAIQEEATVTSETANVYSIAPTSQFDFLWRSEIERLRFTCLSIKRTIAKAEHESRVRNPIVNKKTDRSSARASARSTARSMNRFKAKKGSKDAKTSKKISTPIDNRILCQTALSVTPFETQQPYGGGLGSEWQVQPTEPISKTRLNVSDPGSATEDKEDGATVTYEKRDKELVIKMMRTLAGACQAATLAKAWLHLQNLVRLLWNFLSSGGIRPETIVALSYEDGKQHDGSAESLIDCICSIGSCLLEMLANLKSSPSGRYPSAIAQGAQELRETYRLFPGGDRAIHTSQIDQQSTNDHLIAGENSSDHPWFSRIEILCNQMEHISALFFFILQIFFHDHQWVKLVDHGIAFNHISENIDQRRVMTLLVYAQRRLRDTAKKDMEDKAMEIQKTNDDVRQKSADIREQKSKLRSQRGKKEQDARLRKEKRAFEDKERILAPQLEKLMKAYDREESIFRKLVSDRDLLDRSSRKVLVAVEKSKLYLERHFSAQSGPRGNHPCHEVRSAIVDGKAASAEARESMKNGICSLGPGPISFGRVVRSMKQTVQLLRQKRENVLMARSLLDLGAFFFSKNELDSARQQWNSGIDGIFSTLNSVRARRGIMYGAKVLQNFCAHNAGAAQEMAPGPLEEILGVTVVGRGGKTEEKKGRGRGMVEKYGFWNCVTGSVLAAYIAMHTCGEDSLQRKDSTFLGWALASSLFSVSLQHPNRAMEFRNYKTSDIWPGFGAHMFASESRIRIGQVMDACRFISEELVCMRQPIKSLPILSLYDYFSENISRSLHDIILSRILRCRALSEAGYISNAIEAFQTILSASTLPKLDFGVRIGEILSKSETKTPSYPKFFNDKALAGNRACITWLTSEETTLGDLAESIYPEDIKGRVQLLRVRLLVSIASCSNAIIPRASEEFELRALCYRQALSLCGKIIEEEKKRGSRSIHSLRLELEALRLSVLIQEECCNLSSAVSYAMKALRLLERTKIVTDDSARAVPKRQDSLTVGAFSTRDWLEMNCGMVRLLLKQGRMGEVEERIEKVLKVANKINDVESLSILKLYDMRLARFKNDKAKTRRLASDLWATFTDCFEDPVSGVQNLKKPSNSSGAQSRAIEFVGTFTGMKLVRSAGLTEMPSIAQSFGRGLLEVSYMLSLDPEDPKLVWDAMTVAQQADKLFGYLKEEYGLQMDDKLVHELDMALLEKLRERISDPLEAKGKKSVFAKKNTRNTVPVQPSTSTLSPDVKCTAEEGLERFRAADIPVSRNLYLPFVANFSFNSLQFAGILASRGYLSHAREKAIESERLAMLRQATSPLFLARVNRMVASIDWSSADSYNSILAGEVAKRNSELQRIRSGGVISRPTQHEPLPDNTKLTAARYLHERLSGAAKRLIAAANQHIIYDNDHDALHRCFTMLSEIHRFAGINIPEAPLLEKKGGMSSQYLAVFFLVKAAQTRLQDYALKHGLWEGKDSMATRPLQSIAELPDSIKLELVEIRSYNETLKKAELASINSLKSVAATKSKPRTPTTGRGAIDRKKKGGSETPSVDIVGLMNYYMQIRQSSGMIIDTSHAEKQSFDGKICDIHYFLRGQYTPYQKHCCFSGALQLDPSPCLSPKLHLDKLDISWEDAMKRTGFFCIQWALQKSEAYKGSLYFRLKCEKISMIFFLSSAHNEGHSLSSRNDAKLVSAQLAHRISHLAGELRTEIEGRAHEKVFSDVSGFSPTTRETKVHREEEEIKIKYIILQMVCLLQGCTEDDAQDIIKSTQVGDSIQELLSGDRILRSVKSIEATFDIGRGICTIDAALLRLLHILIPIPKG